PAANGAHPCAPPLRGFSRPIRRYVRGPVKQNSNSNNHSNSHYHGTARHGHGDNGGTAAARLHGCTAAEDT
ncbi:hypothetical protein QSH18_19955, partial [Xanthomonas sp. NCPPB 2654]|uniref:hypothetical protein n=1 Tax=Xanthomonas sp. NCPPB 2654 TaxID=487541 RepID=UPI00256F598A